MSKGHLPVIAELPDDGIKIYSAASIWNGIKTVAEVYVQNEHMLGGYANVGSLTREQLATFHAAIGAWLEANP